jgi:hypothetical protein
VTITQPLSMAALKTAFRPWLFNSSSAALNESILCQPIPSPAGGKDLVSKM